MAAFTRGFTDTRSDSNTIGSVISKVIAARSTAKSEREYAEKVLKRQQKDVPDEDKLTLEDFGIKRGFFFKKALKHEFGGDFYLRKKEKASNLIAKAKLLKNPRKNLSKLFEKSNTTSKFSRFKRQFDYTFIDPSLQPTSEKIPGTAKKIKKATTGPGKRISKEQMLSSLSDIVKSIQAIADSIQSSSDEVKQNIISSNIAQTNIAEQLKVRNDTLADKLDKIAEAISNNTLSQKQLEQKKQNKQRESELEQQKDVAGTTSFDDTSTLINESTENTNIDQDITPTSSITNVQNVLGSTSSQRIEHQQMAAYQNVPQLERGGIISGPDSGYLANLNPGDTVIPLNNNFTQGEPSAVDGQIKKKPKMFERGTSGVGGKFGFGATRNIGIGNTFGANITNMSQPLVDAMSLPMMATGGSILAATSQLINNLGSSGEDMKPEIEKLSRPIADAFGVPPTLERKARGSATKTDQLDQDKEKKDDKDKPNILDQMKEGLAKLLETFTEKINEIPTDVPSRRNGTVDYSNLKSGDISTMAGKAATLYDEFRNIGYTDEGSKRLIAEIGREGGMRNENIFGTHTDPAAGGSNTGMISWRGPRRDKLIAEAKKAGVWDEAKGQFKETAEALRFQARFVANEIPTYKNALDKALKTEGSDASKISAMLRDDYIVYRADAQYSGGRDAEYGSGKTKEWYNRLAPGLEKTYNPGSPSSSLAATPVQAAQQITENFGYNVGERLYFNHSGEQYNAYKTTYGWDIYKGQTKIDTSGGKNAGVLRSFVQTGRAKLKTNDQVSITPPSSRQNQKPQQIAQLNRSAEEPSSIAMLNLLSPQSTEKKLNSPQPSALTDSLSEAGNPLHNSGLYLS